jgi:hypothetical protein
MFNAVLCIYIHTYIHTYICMSELVITPLIPVVTRKALCDTITYMPY